MNTTKEMRKEQALQNLKKMDVYKDFIDCYKKQDYVCYYELGIGYWAFQEEELIAKMHEVEERFNCTVYAITHDFTEFGELYDFLYVPNDKEEWDYALEQEGNLFYAFAYVWNKNDEECSELGTVAVKNRFGGLVRVG